MIQEHIAELLERQAQEMRRGRLVVSQFNAEATLSELVPMNGHRRKAITGYTINMRCDVAEGFWQDTPRG